MSAIIKTIIFNRTGRLIACNNLGFRAYSSNIDPSKFETIAVSIPKKHVFHVELNRPEKLNSFTSLMFTELNQCFTTLSDNSECRVLVLSARGKIFSAGIDLHSMLHTLTEVNDLDDIARKARFMHNAIKQAQDSFTSLELCVKPVINVIHSGCVGAGANLVTAADIRYCTEDAFYQVKEVDVGLAADIGALQRLPKIIGSTSIAREICFTARKVGSKEMLDIGLVSKVFANRETAIEKALELAENIASKSPVAVQTTKMNLVYSQNRSNQDGIDHIRLLNQTMLQSEDLSKAALAQATKSGMPEFENL